MSEDENQSKRGLAIATLLAIGALPILSMIVPFRVATMFMAVGHAVGVAGPLIRRELGVGAARWTMRVLLIWAVVLVARFVDVTRSEREPILIWVAFVMASGTFAVSAWLGYRMPTIDPWSKELDKALENGTEELEASVP